MFKDSTGCISSMRVCMFTVTFTICIVYIVQNIAAIVHGQGLVGLGVYETSTLGLVFGAKIGQNFTENATAAKTVVNNTVVAPVAPAVDQGGSMAKTPDIE